MGSTLPSWVVQVLSPPRFNGYLVATSGDVRAAIALYRWNVEVSAAFVVPLHWAEMAFRNAVHARLAVHLGRDDWWNAGLLDPNGLRKIQEATGALRRRGREPVPSDSVMAELSFGFWVSLLASRYTRTLWVPVLHRVFPGRSRRAVHTDFQHVLDLRNRVSHGEPIHHRDLDTDHAIVCRLLGELSLDALRESSRSDQVSAVLARRGGL